MVRSRTTTFLLASMVMLVTTANSAAQPIDIGSRLELLVDDALIEAMQGGARLQLHSPAPARVAPNRGRYSKARHPPSGGLNNG